MLRLLLGVGALVLVVGGLIAILARMNVVKVNQKVAGTAVTQALQGSTDTPSAANNYGATELPPQSPLTKSAFLDILNASMSAITQRLDALELKQSNQPVAALSGTVTPTPTSASYAGPKSIYIPIGYGGSTTSSSGFANISGQEVTIDPANYPGYKQMVFEVSARIFQGNGTAQIRLGNKTDGTSILNSAVSTTSSDYVELTSGGFTLPSGSKTYVIQAQSTTGYSVDLQLSRIRVDF